MREIVKILCGSHLYGTDVEGSDRDYKIVYIPSGDRILLQRADSLDPEDVGNAVRHLKKEAKLYEDPDVEFISLRQYLKLLCQGQTNALDMLFAPEQFYVGKPEGEWLAIRAQIPRWLSKNSAAFVGYCRQQSSKYAVRIDRYETVKAAVVFFKEAVRQGFDVQRGLLGVNDQEGLTRLVEENEHIEWQVRPTASGSERTHLSVCECMVDIGASPKMALDVYSGKLDKYGQRIKAASNLGEKDWKSLYHAVRVAEEAIELMETGKITLPRPEKSLLTAIRRGKIPFDTVSSMIERNLEIVEKAVEDSTLPEKPDWDHADKLVVSFYKSAVL
jgi:hypothetical protein